MNELFTPNEMVGNCDVQQASYAGDGQTSESCWEANRWIAVELGGQLDTICDDRWWLASDGVDWWMASNDVEWHKRAQTWNVPLVLVVVGVD